MLWLTASGFSFVTQAGWMWAFPAAAHWRPRPPTRTMVGNEGKMRLLYLAIVSSMVSGMYLAALPSDWEWHAQVAAATSGMLTFLMLRAAFRRKAPAKK